MGLHQLRLREPLGLCQHRLTLKVEVLDHEREFRSFRFGGPSHLLSLHRADPHLSTNRLQHLDP
jgi:hypothetical protein